MIRWPENISVHFFQVRTFLEEAIAARELKIWRQVRLPCIRKQKLTAKQLDRSETARKINGGIGTAT
ncbi:protein of unknown function [Methylocaldum szegediense]|uniref:Transposase n=1 Tax=Methylocaldum szegediense TaxID=73780 RepID=A0ABM9I2N8_9GAMM|nr:protein of unknown function [Methylocaldum szegediense]